MTMKLLMWIAGGLLAAPALGEPRVIEIRQGVARDVTAARFNPRAAELIESDPAIRQWAVGKFDKNGDGWLTAFEAQPAAQAFRDIADADRDGAVSVREYRDAVDFIRTRY